MMKKIFCAILVCAMLVATASASGANDLQYSTYSHTPVNYASQNCYGYALGRAVAVDPGYYSSKSYNTLDQFEAAVIADLGALGYSVRKATSANASLKSNEVMLAYYYGTWRTREIGGGNFGEINNTYHFWLKPYTGASWNHKFGRSSGIMKANYIPMAANKSFVCDEFYNEITDQYASPWFFAIGNAFGYIIFNYYDDVSPLSTGVADINTISGELDHSAAAMIGHLR